MDMERDFIAIKEELENIASGLRKLVVSEVDSPLEPQTSPSSSTEGVGMKRLFKAEEDSEVASKTSSTDQLDWRPLFQSVELLPQSDESSSHSDLHLQRLFKEDKEVATSVSGVQLRKLLSRADPRSLSDLCLAGLFRDDPAAAAQSLSHLGLDRLFKEGATEPKSLSSLCLNQLFKDDPKLRESLSNLGTRRLFHQAKPVAASLSDLGVRQLYQWAEDASKKSAESEAASPGLVAAKVAAIQATAAMKMAAAPKPTASRKRLRTKQTTPQRRVAVKKKWMTATAISCNGFISSLAYSITFRWTCAMMPNMKRGRKETRSSRIFWITSSLSSPLSSASASLWPEMRLQMRQTRSSPKVTFVLRRDFWPVPRAIVISSCARSENKSPMIG